MITVTLDKVNGTDVTNDIRAIKEPDIVPGSFRPLTANNTATAAVFKIKTQDSNGNAVYEQWQTTETYATVLANLTADSAAAGAQLLSNLVTSISGASTDAQYPSAKLLFDLLALKAALASPTFTGIPAAPTAAGGTNTTQLATTAFVQAAIDALIGGAPGALDTLNELAAALADDANYATTITNALALKAALASPTFTGTPAAPTAAPGTDTTQLATTAFVEAARVILAAATALKADLASPTFTGTPAAPTAALGTGTTQLATTEFTQNEIIGNTYNFGAATGTDTYTLNPHGLGITLATGMVFYCTFQNANTGASTINVEGSGVKDIRKGTDGATALAGADLVTTKIYTLIYDGTNFQINL